MGSKPLGLGAVIRNGEAMTDRTTLEALLARIKARMEGLGE